MLMNWDEMKDEYVHTSIGLRPLAQKYGATARQVSYRAKKEGWFIEKQQNLAQQTAFFKENQALFEKPREDVSETDISILADKLYQKANLAIDALDGEKLDTQRLRHLVQSVKDLKDLVRPEDEAKEAGRLEALIKGLCKA